MIPQSTRNATLERICQDAKDCGEQGAYVIEWVRRHVPQSAWEECAQTMDFYGLPMAGELRGE